MQRDENENAVPEAENPELEDATSSEDSSASQTAEASSDDENRLSGEETEGQEAQDSEEPRKKRGLERRFSELTSQLREAKAALRAYESERERLYQTQPRAAPQDAEAEPSRDQFDDYEDYLVARARYAARQSVLEERQRMEAERQQRLEVEAQQAINERWDVSHDKAIERYDDYLDMYEVIGTSINKDLAAAIKSADDPAEVVYHLGKNPKEFAKLRDKSGMAAVKEVGRIEERITASRQKRSAAPKPPSPVRGNAKATHDPLDVKLGTDQWMKNRMEQRAKRRSESRR